MGGWARPRRLRQQTRARAQLHWGAHSKPVSQGPLCTLLCAPAGMPYPQNLATAQEVEAVVRQHGAVPATIAIIRGQCCIGLDPQQLEHIARRGQEVRKVSRRHAPAPAPLLLLVGPGGGGGPFLRRLHSMCRRPGARMAARSAAPARLSAAASGAAGTCRTWWACSWTAPPPCPPPCCWQQRQASASSSQVRRRAVPRLSEPAAPRRRRCAAPRRLLAAARAQPPKRRAAAPPAAGGIGGVHRGGESSLDVSADLTELGRTPVAVVCAGAKSVLDIPRTLEFLETQVCAVCAVCAVCRVACDGARAVGGPGERSGRRSRRAAGACAWLERGPSGGAPPGGANVHAGFGREPSAVSRARAPPPQGACVAAYGADEFPAFFTPRSGCKAPCRVDTPQQWAAPLPAADDADDADAAAAAPAPRPLFACAHAQLLLVLSCLRAQP